MGGDEFLLTTPAAVVADVSEREARKSRAGVVFW
jgi:hypothetical protein